MADDTRQTPTTTSDAASSSDPNVRKPGTKYESFVPGASGDNPNVMPGGTQHTAGGEKIGGVSLSDGFKTIQPQDFLEIHKYPCVREAILTSIGTGFGTGGLMAIWGSKSCCKAIIIGLFAWILTNCIQRALRNRATGQPVFSSSHPWHLTSSASRSRDWSGTEWPGRSKSWTESGKKSGQRGKKSLQHGGRPRKRATGWRRSA